MVGQSDWLPITMAMGGDETKSPFLAEAKAWL
jgi:hypothetical protein